ncbi:MAG: DUF3842 family protein [Clostridia bacterium]
MKEALIVVIDGLGGGIGKSIVEKLKTQLPCYKIVAVGTNSYASETMRKAGADTVFNTEDDLIRYAHKADIIVSVMGVLIPGGLAGELTSEMVNAISSSKAIKVLIPMNKCGIRVATAEMPLNSHIDAAINLIKNELSI